jgi:dTDP-4-amino-4,6-dideoxygalactose transaminase
LLQMRGVRRLWLPAYICLAAASAAEGLEIVWYGVDADLAPDLADFEGRLRRGDAVMAVDYFGRLPPEAFLELVRSRTDVLWIEDRAQALAPGPAWGQASLYSPRKLVGVGDGGLLVSDSPVPSPSDQGLPEPEAAAQHARLADPAGVDPPAWYPAYQAQEAAFRVDRRPMSAVSAERLSRVAARPIAAARRANWEVLAEALSPVALWPEVLRPAFVPLAFPVRTSDAAAASRRMAEAGIFCPRHWAELPSPAGRFTAAEVLSGSLLSLPCDQRYGPSDMRRVADAFLAL